MRKIECIHTDSSCYKEGRAANMVGIVVHSTGANNVNLARYVQPSKSSANYGDLVAIIGKNAHGNSWNRAVNKAVHYMIGKLADGSIATAQTLPETICCWGVGSGVTGSYNYNPYAHIQFEVLEDDLKSEEYFRAVYKEAIELCADICKRHGWCADRIVSHKECHDAGYGSNHADIDHWLRLYSMTMDDFRKDVEKLLYGDKPAKPIEAGEKVNFVGTKHYTNSGALLGKAASPCEAVVERVYRLGAAKHPYLVRGKKVNGWVDVDDVKRQTEAEEVTHKVIAEGDIITFTGTKHYSNSGALIGKKATACKAVVQRIYRLGVAKHPYLIKGTGVNGWVNAEDIRKD